MKPMIRVLLNVLTSEGQSIIKSGDLSRARDWMDRHDCSARYRHFDDDALLTDAAVRERLIWEAFVAEFEHWTQAQIRDLTGAVQDYLYPRDARGIRRPVTANA